MSFYKLKIYEASENQGSPKTWIHFSHIKRTPGKYSLSFPAWLLLRMVFLSLWSYDFSSSPITRTMGLKVSIVIFLFKFLNFNFPKYTYFSRFSLDWQTYPDISVTSTCNPWTCWKLTWTNPANVNVSCLQLGQTRCFSLNQMLLTGVTEPNNSLWP